MIVRLEAINVPWTAWNHVLFLDIEIWVRRSGQSSLMIFQNHTPFCSMLLVCCDGSLTSRLETNTHIIVSDQSLCTDKHWSPFPLLSDASFLVLQHSLSNAFVSFSLICPEISKACTSVDPALCSNRTNKWESLLFDDRFDHAHTYLAIDGSLRAITGPICAQIMVIEYDNKDTRSPRTPEQPLSCRVMAPLLSRSRPGLASPCEASIRYRRMEMLDLV